MWTCARPLAAETEFQDWQDRFLWIKGKPGAGKSTLMKEVARITVYQKRDQAIVTFVLSPLIRANH
jgi:ABC-type lipoprotein export system ATPase subunit